MRHHDEIRALLSTYQQALNDSDVTVAAMCYANDGVFIPSMIPAIVGAAMRDGYVQIFRIIKLSVTFEVDELVVASDTVAYALTSSNGTQVILATGAESTESNRELIHFHARFCSVANRSLPLQQASLTTCGRSAGSREWR